MLWRKGKGGSRCFDVCLEGEYGLALLVEDVPGVHVSVLPGHEEDGGSGGAPAAVQQPLCVGAADTVSVVSGYEESSDSLTPIL